MHVSINLACWHHLICASAQGEDLYLCTLTNRLLDVLHQSPVHLEPRYFVDRAQGDAPYG